LCDIGVRAPASVSDRAYKILIRSKQDLWEFFLAVIGFIFLTGVMGVLQVMIGSKKEITKTVIENS
jgi:hypothetical protein